MSVFRVKMSFPLSDGTYSDYTDVTEDVSENSFSSITQKLEASEYDVGKITFGNIKLKFRNEKSKYSEAINPSSIFPIKRDRTKVQITWARNTHEPICGNVRIGFFLSSEQIIFRGLIEDSATDFNSETQEITFAVLSLDSIIAKTPTPYADLLVSDNAETLLYKILNQTDITNVLTVDALNISVANNFTPDDISELEETTCLEAIQQILIPANAVMFEKDEKIFIRSRDEDATISQTFYGASSDNGIENIVDIPRISDGLNRCFNFVVWKDTNLVAKFDDSIEIYGLRKKEIESPLITNNTKRQAVLSSYLNEFGFPKKEIELEVNLTTPISKLTFLNKVNIDFPAIALGTPNELIARYNQAVYGVSKYPLTNSATVFSAAEEWKILNKKINTRSHTATYKLRRI